MSSTSEGALLRRFKTVAIIGIFAVPLVGVLLKGATGWSPWITYGVPLVILILVTIPLLRAARRQQAEMGGAEPKPNRKTPW
jgi:hypothetical protein